jgi:hypothetical protein
MVEYKRKNISDKYFAIQIFECPIDIVILAATLGGKNVTIENYSHNRNLSSVSISIRNNNLTITPSLKCFLADFQITKADFILLEEIWDKQGCYAIFHDNDEIKFKATDLNEYSRYNALDNSKWTLEISIPDAASDGWGQITSPQRTIIDEIERHIKNNYNPL